MAEERSVDITGTMSTPVPDWEIRTKQLAKPEFWYVEFKADAQLWHELSEEERTRLGKKMEMVAEAARWMLAGMVKGTVKYARDDWTMDRWMAHLVGEGADQMNYQLLLFNAYHQKKAEEESKVKKAWEGQ